MKNCIRSEKRWCAIIIDKLRQKKNKKEKKTYSKIF